METNLMDGVSAHKKMIHPKRRVISTAAEMLDYNPCPGQRTDVPMAESGMTLFVSVELDLCRQQAYELFESRSGVSWRQSNPYERGKKEERRGLDELFRDVLLAKELLLMAIQMTTTTQGVPSNSLKHGRRHGSSCNGRIPG